MQPSSSRGSDSWQSAPARPPAPAGEVHLWRVDLETSASTSTGLLAAAELARAARIRAAAGRRRWATSRWALREILGRYLGEPPGEVSLTLGEHGKPQLSAAPLEFNLSHSAGLALVAVAETTVGIDVERIDPDRDFVKLAERALDPAAVAAVRAAAEDQRPAAFYAAWTEHEARLKCDGGGFGARAGCALLAACALDVGEGYAAALAVPGRTPPSLRRYLLDLR